MTEKETPFSPEEAISIGEYAKDFARLGEDAIFDLIRKKNQLSITSANSLDALPANVDTVLLGRQLMHEVKVISEIIRQAKAIRQVMGQDEFTNLMIEVDEEKGKDG